MNTAIYPGRGIISSALAAMTVTGLACQPSSPPNPIESPRPAATAPPVGDPPTTETPSAIPTAKLLDKSTAEAIVRDFEEDFEKASRKYQGERWAFTAKVEAAGPGRKAFVFPDFTLSCDIDMKDVEVTKNLVRGKTYRFTAEILPVAKDKGTAAQGGMTYSLRGASRAAQRSAAAGAVTTLEWSFQNAVAEPAG